VKNEFYIDVWHDL